MAASNQQDITDAVLKAAEVIESEVDKRLEDLKAVDDFEALRAQRLALLKKQAENRQKWIAAGHGKVWLPFVDISDVILVFFQLPD
jgi:hypothetical protein